MPRRARQLTSGRRDQDRRRAAGAAPLPSSTPSLELPKRGAAEASAPAACGQSSSPKAGRLLLAGPHLERAGVDPNVASSKDPPDSPSSAVAVLPPAEESTRRPASPPHTLAPPPRSPLAPPSSASSGLPLSSPSLPPAERLAPPPPPHTPPPLERAPTPSASPPSPPPSSTCSSPSTFPSSRDSDLLLSPSPTAPGGPPPPPSPPPLPPSPRPPLPPSLLTSSGRRHYLGLSSASIQATLMSMRGRGLGKARDSGKRGAPAERQQAEAPPLPTGEGAGQSKAERTKLQGAPGSPPPPGVKAPGTGWRKAGGEGSEGMARRSRWPSLPSYVPFGHLYLLGAAAAEPLAGADLVASTTIRSIIAEMRDRFQSHTMRSYRARFQNMYGLCMTEGIPFPAAVLEQLPKLNNWMTAGGMAAVQPGMVASPLVVRAATSVVPLGWTGVPGEGGAAPLRVDVQGFNLHLCSNTRAFIDGRWWAAEVEAVPVAPPHVPISGTSSHRALQSMRLRVGGPLKVPPRVGSEQQQQQQQQQQTEEKASGSKGAASMAGAPNGSSADMPDQRQATTGPMPATASAGAAAPSAWVRRVRRLAGQLAAGEGESATPAAGGEGGGSLISIDDREWEGGGSDDGAGEVLVECSSDFNAALHPVALRLRRVRLVGLEGAGKTSLFGALLGNNENTAVADGSGGGVMPDTDYQEGVTAGVGYIDCAGVNMQDLDGEVLRLRQELAPRPGALKSRVDLIVLVHNLAHKIPRLRPPLASAGAAVAAPPFSLSAHLNAHLRDMRQLTFFKARPRQAETADCQAWTSQRPAAVGEGPPVAAVVGTVPDPGPPSSEADISGDALRPPPPALSVVLREAEAAGVPVVLALTNKYAASAERRHLAAAAVMETYGIPPTRAAIVNSRPYAVYGPEGMPQGGVTAEDVLQAAAQQLEEEAALGGAEASLRDAQARVSVGPAAEKGLTGGGIMSGALGGVQGVAVRLMQAPRGLLSLVQLRKQEAALPVGGVKELRSLVHSILRQEEEVALQDVAAAAAARLAAREAAEARVWSAPLRDREALHHVTAAAAAAGAAFGASLGVVLALTMAAGRRRP